MSHLVPLMRSGFWMYSWITLYWSYCRSESYLIIVIFLPLLRSVGLQIHIYFSWSFLSACFVNRSTNCLVSFGRQYVVGMKLYILPNMFLFLRMILAKLSFVHRAPVFGKWINFWYDLPAWYSPMVGLKNKEKMSKHNFVEIFQINRKIILHTPPPSDALQSILLGSKSDAS